MSEARVTEDEKEPLARMDTTGESPDIRTASAASGDAHTPGPWSMQEVWPSGPGFAVVASGKSYHIAGCGAYQSSHPGAAFTDAECRANGRLIAAAPDLLAALKAICDDASELEYDDAGYSAVPSAGVDMARAAIAKAEGR